MILVLGLWKTVHALDCTATVTGKYTTSKRASKLLKSNTKLKI
jgi:hypothetical protein